MEMLIPTPSTPDRGLADESAWRLIRDAMAGLKFGSVTLTVRDGLLIQVHRADGGAVLREPRAV